MNGRRSAFTLVELLVVIAITGLLLSILLPALSRARGNAKQVKCGANLRQLGVALQTYVQEQHDWYPRWSGYHAWGFYRTEQDGTDGDDTGPAWIEQLRDEGALLGTEIYRCPAYPESVKFSYFVTAYAAWERHAKRSTRVNWIRFPAEFVLSGDCSNRFFFLPPFGTGEDTMLQVQNADLDNASRPCLDWANPVHLASRLSVLFADTHVAVYPEFRAAEMTHDSVNRAVDWGAIDTDD